MIINNKHIPVLNAPILKIFLTIPSGWILDATFGNGGHTILILTNYPNIKICAIDQDLSVLYKAIKIKKLFPNRFKFYYTNFINIDKLINFNFVGILLDLGISSTQLKNHIRGFSIKNNGPLDMRMNPKSLLNASTFINNASKESLIKAIKDYGEELNWKKIINSIIMNREKQPFKNTQDLINIVKKNTFYKRSIPVGTLMFQGIRIYINNELITLEKGLPLMIKKLLLGGIINIMSFHSLEDKIIKKWINSLSLKKNIKIAMNNSYGELIYKKPLYPMNKELRQNSQSRSVKLRIIRLKNI